MGNKTSVGPERIARIGKGLRLFKARRQTADGQHSAQTRSENPDNLNWRPGLARFIPSNEAGETVIWTRSRTAEMLDCKSGIQYLDLLGYREREGIAVDFDTEFARGKRHRTIA